MQVYGLLEEVTAIRQLINDPAPKTPGAARQAFAAFVQQKHGISDLGSPEGAAYLTLFDDWASIQDILKYMGYR